MERLLIVPAAGAGSRLGHTLPKLLVAVDGRSMIDHVLTLYSAFVERVVLVVRPTVEADVQRHVRTWPVPVEMAIQNEPTGMLDAILLAGDTVGRLRPRRIWITWCDQIALLPGTVEKLQAADALVPEPPLALPTCRMRNPYVHFERDATNRITRVLHRREGDDMPASGESDAGLFDLSLTAYRQDLAEYARTVDVGARTGERNFVPFVAWMAARGDVVTVPCSLEEEAMGVNTPDDLRRIEAHLRARRP